MEKPTIGMVKNPQTLQAYLIKMADATTRLEDITAEQREVWNKTQAKLEAQEAAQREAEAKKEAKRAKILEARKLIANVEAKAKAEAEAEARVKTAARLEAERVAAARKLIKESG